MSIDICDDPYPQDDGSPTYLGQTDSSKLLRVLLAILLILCALAGPVVILATHLTPAQKVLLPAELSSFKDAEPPSP